MTDAALKAAARARVATLVQSFHRHESDYLRATYNETQARTDFITPLLEQISGFSHESLLVKSADVISNVSEILDDHARYGDEVFSRFSAPKVKFIHHSIRVMETIIEKWKENPLLPDLEYLAKKMQEI